MIGKVRQYRILKFFFGALLPPKTEPATNKYNNHNDEATNNDIYDVLGVSRNATPDEIRKAFRQRAIVFHPDKQMQRNNAFVLTEEQTESFQRLKSAYETLMDPTKRKIYDTLGEKAVHYMEQPQAISYQEILSNLSHASCWSRTKLNLLLLIFAGLLIIQPLLICLNIDRTSHFGDQQNTTNKNHQPYWPWTAVLVPLWCFNIFVFDYFGSLFISLQGTTGAGAGGSGSGGTNDLDHDPSTSPSARAIWVKAAIFSVHGLSQYQSVLFLLLQFILIVVTELLLALKLDGFITWSYQQILTPLFLQQLFKFLSAIRSIRRVRYDISKMITISQLALRTGKDYSDLTENERRVYNKIYTIVHIPQVAGQTSDEEQQQQHQRGPIDFVQQSHEYLDAKKIKFHAYLEILAVVFHAIFLGLLIYSMESSSSSSNTTSSSITSWWLTFIPIFVLLVAKCFLLCYQAFASILFPEKIYYSPLQQHEQQQPHAQQQYTSSSSFSQAPSSANQTKRNSMGRVPSSRESISSASYNSSKNLLKQKSGRMDEDDDDVAAVLSSLPDARSVYTPSSPPTDGSYSRNTTFTTTYDNNNNNGARVNGDDTEQDDEQFFYAARDSTVDLLNDTAKHCFIMTLMIVVLCLFIGKLEGAHYSSIWIMFPFLLFLGLFVFCFCCAVYCVTDIGDEQQGMDPQQSGKYDSSDPDVDTPVGAAPHVIIPNQNSSSSMAAAAAADTTTSSNRRGSNNNNNVQMPSQSSLFEID